MPQKQMYYPQPIQQAYDNDYQTQLAQQLMQMGGSTAPAQTPTVAIARALQGIVGGWQAKKAREKYDTQAENRQGQMAALLAGLQGGEDPMSALEFAPPDMKDALTTAVVMQKLKGANGGRMASAEEKKAYGLDVNVPVFLDANGKPNYVQAKNPQVASPGQYVLGPDGQPTGQLTPEYADPRYVNTKAYLNSIGPNIAAGTADKNRQADWMREFGTGVPMPGNGPSARQPSQAPNGVYPTNTSGLPPVQQQVNTPPPNQFIGGRVPSRVERDAESTLLKERAKAGQKRYEEIQLGGRAAQDQLAKITKTKESLGDAITGPYAGVRLFGAKAINAVTAGKFFGEEIHDTETLQRYLGQSALEMRNPAGGAGMPGAMSDKDREFLTDIAGRIDNQQATLQDVLLAKEKIAQRNMDIARMADDYVIQYGKLDENFNKQIRAFSEQNLLFPQSTQYQERPYENQMGGWKVRKKQ